MLKEFSVVNSSVLSYVKYDDKTNILQITFKSGKTYNYHNVDILTYNNFLIAPSKGKFFTTFIKNNPNFKDPNFTKRG